MKKKNHYLLEEKVALEHIKNEVLENLIHDIKFFHSGRQITKITTHYMCGQEPCCNHSCKEKISKLLAII